MPILKECAPHVTDYIYQSLSLYMTAPGYSAMAARLFPAKDEVFTPETEGHWICHTYGWKVSDKRGIEIVMFQLYFIRNIMPKYFLFVVFSKHLPLTVLFYYVSLYLISLLSSRSN